MNLDNIKYLNNINIVPEFYQNIIKASIEISGSQNPYPVNMINNIDI